MRIQNDHPVGNGGWFYRFEQPIKFYRTSPVKQEPTPEIDATVMMEVWLKKNQTDWLERESQHLGVSFESLVALQCAWANEHNAWAFPMRSGEGDIIGIRLRNSTGKKWAVKGSRQGIFIPQIPVGRTAAVTEGPSDTAAAISLGLFAIGRASCSAGAEQLKVAFKRMGVHRTIIISDNDNPGIEGARRLALELKVPTCLFIPPTKDLREFLVLGGTREILNCMVKDLIWNQP